MKRLMTAFAVAAPLIVASGAFADPYVWDGGASPPDGNWKVDGNWDDSGWPGDDGAADSALINLDNADVTVAGDIPDSGSNADLAWVKIDAAANDSIVSLVMATNGILSIGGGADPRLELTGGNAASNTATFQYDAGTITVPEFDMDGGDTIDRCAVLDINAELLLVDTDIRAAGFSFIVVADETEFKVEDFEVESGADVEIRGETSTDAMFRHDSLTISGTGKLTFTGPITIATY